MFKDKNLLVLSHTYNSFIKDPVEILAKDFKKIYVLVRYQPIAELGNIIPLHMFSSRKKFSKRYSIDLRNKPENVEVILVPLWYLPFKPFYKFVGWSHARGVLKILKREKIDFDLIHAHFAWSAGYAGMKVKEKYNKNLVITGHGEDIYAMPFWNNSWKGRIKEVLNSADESLTVSNYTKEFYKKIGVRNEPKVFFNGFNEKIFGKVNKQESRNKLGYPKNKKIILTIGNLEKIKGYDVLIESLKIVKEKRKDFLCIHIGAGSEEKKIRHLTRKYGLEKNVKLLGRKPHHELRNWYGICDFFVSPSLFETGPVVMFESLACGRGFVGTKVGAAPDVVNSEDYGKLSTPGDAAELAKNILWGLEKSWDTDKISEYSRQFSWTKTVEEIVKIYSKFLCS